MSKHPNNGPSFSKPTYKTNGQKKPPSPERKQAELDQAARDCADIRLMSVDPAAWVEKNFPKE